MPRWKFYYQASFRINKYFLEVIVLLFFTQGKDFTAFTAADFILGKVSCYKHMYILNKLQKNKFAYNFKLRAVFWKARKNEEKKGEEKKERENKKKKRRRERTINKKNKKSKFLNCACWHAKAIKCP